MKKLLLIGVLLLTLTSFAQEKNCLDFKVGKFTYSDPGYADLITIRNDSIQTDSYPNMGWEITSSVKWLTDCKYEIECIAVNDPKMKPLIGIKYVIEIIEINNNKIVCRSESVGITVDKEMIKAE